MKAPHSLRTAITAAVLLTAPAAAHADAGITTTGWMSLFGVAGIVGALYWVHKRLG
jgi:hypothetical protein